MAILFTGRCCSVVSQLYLVGCNISDQQITKMVPGICHSAALRELWLKANPIGEQGVLALAKAIKNNKALVLLSLLGCSSIGNKGATTLVQSLLSNTSLKHLQLSEAFKTACEQVPNYSSVSHQINWFEDFTLQSVMKIENKNVDCEVLGMVYFKNGVSL